jgi:hypothetical protein
MVGVGSGSALNAFNIGQAATPKSAVGQQIEQIVAQRDKIDALNAQSGAQAAGSLATAQFKAQQDAAPVDQFTVNPVTNELIPVGQVPGNAKVNFPTLTENALRLAEDQRFEAEEKAKKERLGNQGGGEVDLTGGITAGLGAGVQPAPGGNVQDVGQNTSVSPFAVGGQGVAAPVAQPGASGLKSPEFQGLDPSIFNTPEGKAIIDRIIQQKLQAGGGSI